MAKQKTQHPKTKEVKIIMVDGSYKVINMVLSQDALQLDIDPNTHRAWQKDAKFTRSSRVEKMREKFGKFDF